MPQRYRARAISHIVLVVLLTGTAALASKLPPQLRPSAAGLNFKAFYGTGSCSAVSAGDSVLVIGKGGSIEYYDLTTPGGPSSLGSLAIGITVQHLIYEGAVTYAVVGDGLSASLLLTIDSADPSAPAFLATYFPPGRVVGFGKHGDYVYLASTSNTTIVNVTNPSAMAFAGNTLQSNTTVGFGNNLYLLNNMTLRVMDNTNPAAPAEIGSLTYTYTMYDIALSADGQTAYVTEDGVNIVDISTPATPSHLGKWQTAPLEFVRDIALSSAGLYAIHQSGSVYLLDVTTDTQSPSTIGSLTLNTALVTDVTVSPANPNYAYFPVGTGALTADFTTPVTPVQGGFMYTGYFINDILAEDVSGQPAFGSAAGQDNIRVSTASDIGGVQRYRGLETCCMIPLPPLYAALFGADDNYKLVETAKKVAGTASSLINAALFAGINVVNVDNVNATIEGSVTTGTAAAMTMDTNYLFVAEGSSGDISVIDVTTQTAPTLGATFNTGGNAQDVSFDDINQMLAVANGLNPDRVQIYNMFQPLSPVLLKGFSPGVNIATIVIKGSVLYAADINQNVYIYVLSANPAIDPQLIGTFSLGTFSDITSLTTHSQDDGSFRTAAAATTEYLIVTASEAGVFVFDVTIPDTAKVAGTYNTGDLAMSSMVLNNEIYVADGFAGWYVLELDPIVPVLITNFDAEVRGGAAELRWTISADEAVEGVDIQRASEGGELRSILEGRLLDINARRFVDDTVEPGRRYQYQLLVRKPDGSVVQSPRVVLDMPAVVTKLMNNYPTPFNPGTTIAFELAARDHVSVTVYDVTGARVATIADRPFPPGRGEVSWDGRDEAGHAAASGVYLYTVRVGKKAFQGKMQLLK